MLMGCSLGGSVPPPPIITVLEKKIEFTGPNQILEFFYIVLNKN